MSFLSSLDPTSSGSIWRKGLRQMDPTNPNSLEGKVWKYAVPVVAGSFLGPLGGAAAGMGVSALQGGNVGSGAVQGAALGGISSLLGPSAAAAAPAAAPTAIPGAGTDAPDAWNASGTAVPITAPSGAGSVAPAAPATVAPDPTPAIGSDPTLLGGIGSKLAAAPGDILSWAEAHPQLATSLAGTAASMYGASQLGAAQQRQQNFQNNLLSHRAGIGTPRMSYNDWNAQRQLGQ